MDKVDELFQSIVCLAERLSVASSNHQPCKKLQRKYKQLLVKPKKSDKIYTAIIARLQEVIKDHKEDIMNKDFSFLESGILRIDEEDIGTMYLAVVDECDVDKLELVVTELLYLFCQGLSDEDKNIVYEKYKTKQSDTSSGNATSTKSTPEVPLRTGVDSILKKHQHILNKAEKNPKLMNEAISSILKGSSNELAGMLNGVLGNFGLDMSKGKNK